MTDHPKARGIAISAWWVLVIIVPICIVVLWVAVDHANKAQDRAQQRANQQFRQSLIVTDRKFRQALRVTTQQFSYAQNRQVCAFRELTLPALKSYKDAAKDKTLSASARARNDLRIRTTEKFLNGLVTIPINFDCASLPKNAPKASTP